MEEKSEQQEDPLISFMEMVTVERSKKRKRIKQCCFTNILKRRKYDTKRAYILESKDIFVLFMRSICPTDNEQAQKYIKQLQDTSLEDWVVQMKGSIWPFVKWGKTEVIVQMVLLKAGMKKDELYFKIPNKKEYTPAEKTRDAERNYLEIIEYLNLFAKQCKEMTT